MKPDDYIGPVCGCPGCRAARSASASKAACARWRDRSARLLRDHKTCKTCGVYKETAHFTRHRTAVDGLKSSCKTCVAAYEKRRKALARKPRRILSGSEKRERRRIWSLNSRSKNRARYNAVRRRSRAKHRATTTAATRAYYWRNRARQIERVAQYFKRYPEKKSQHEAKRRAQQRSARSEKVDYALIMVRDRMRCHTCGGKVKRAELHFDHVIPLSKGGTHVTENIAVSHARCNLSKGAKVTSLF